MVHLAKTAAVVGRYELHRFGDLLEPFTSFLPSFLLAIAALWRDDNFACWVPPVISISFARSLAVSLLFSLSVFRSPNRKSTKEEEEVGYWRGSERASERARKEREKE